MKHIVKLKSDTDSLNCPFEHPEKYKCRIKPRLVCPEYGDGWDYCPNKCPLRKQDIIITLEVKADD